MSWLKDINNFLEEYSTVYPDNSEIDIYKDLGIIGDDFTEMINNYAATYKVDMSNYLWYFHNCEEGMNVGAFFFKSTDKQVNRIPVTPKMLANFIEQKKWNINYPNHRILNNRYDLLLSKIVYGFIIILSIFILAVYFLSQLFE